MPKKQMLKKRLLRISFSWKFNFSNELIILTVFSQLFNTMEATSGKQRWVK